MAYSYYNYDYPPPIVDHLHQRTHQHQNFFQYLSHQKPPRPEDYPNQPDVNIRNAFTEYIIDIEVPGIKDPHAISVSWTTSRSLVVSGSIVGLESSAGHSRAEKPEKPAEDKTGTRDAHGDWKEPNKTHEPELLVGERRLGPFRRHFSFPDEVNMDELTAKLDAGLLTIYVPKKGLTVAKAGRVDVE
jgi:HSP20 family molecular chaperone IbpA